MNDPSKRQGTSYWSRVENAGEAMELGMRLILGLFFAFLLPGFAWWIGSDLWGGIAALLALIAFPIGFLVGFFWLEVKLVVRLVLGSMV